MFPYLSFSIKDPSEPNLARSTSFGGVGLESNSAGVAIATVDSNPNRFRKSFLFIIYYLLTTFKNGLKSVLYSLLRLAILIIVSINDFLANVISELPNP